MQRPSRSLLVDRASLPTPDGLPWYVAPLPERLEDLALRLAVPIALINLAGTAFGFWYYRFQFADAPLAAWPVIPDSPLATLFIALSLLAWRVGRPSELLNALAFFGCIKLGLWTPFVQVFLNGPEGIATWLYVFLIGSHLAMAVEAFVIHRYGDFPVYAVAVALVWYGGNDVVDYFVTVLDGPHHTGLRAELTATGVSHAVPAHDLAAACAVVLTMLATFLALATRAKTLELRPDVEV